MASAAHKVDISWDRRPAGVVVHVVFDNARRLNVQSVPRHLADGDAAVLDEKFPNVVLPGVGLVAGFLLWLDMLVLKLLIRPPLCSPLV